MFEAGGGKEEGGTASQGKEYCHRITEYLSVSLFSLAASLALCSGVGGWPSLAVISMLSEYLYIFVVSCSFLMWLWNLISQYVYYKATLSNAAFLTQI